MYDVMQVFGKAQGEFKTVRIVENSSYRSFELLNA